VQASPVDKSGMVMIFAITNPKNMGKVDAAIQEEVVKFLKDGVSGSELEEAKKAYVQSLRTARSSDAALAGKLATALFVGRTLTFDADLEKKIEAVQPGDVAKAFNKYLAPGKLAVIQAGDLASAKEPEKKK
jgi:zinc protease